MTTNSFLPLSDRKFYNHLVGYFISLGIFISYLSASFRPGTLRGGSGEIS